MTNTSCYQINNIALFLQKWFIPLDLEEIKAVSKKVQQDEEIHSEHVFPTKN